MRVLLLDLKNMAYRAFYSYLEPLKNSQGKITTVCYGVAQSLNTLIRDFGPDAMIAVTDQSGGTTFRHEIYPLYKSNRTHNPDFHSQIPDLMRLLDAYNIKVFSIDNVEADDVIGTLAKKYAGEGHEVFIVSNDKDFMQLIGPNVKIIAPTKGTYKIIGENEVMEKFGCRPDQVVDCLALMGDAVDCVPGVKGIGQKTATALIKSGGDLDGIYSLLGTYKPGVASKLMAGRDMAYLSKRLVTLKVDLGLDHPIEDFTIDRNPLEREEVKKLFEEFEFHSMLSGNAAEDLVIQLEE